MQLDIKTSLHMATGRQAAPAPIDVIGYHLEDEGLAYAEIVANVEVNGEKREVILDCQHNVARCSSSLKDAADIGQRLGAPAPIAQGAAGMAGNLMKQVSNTCGQRESVIIKDAATGRHISPNAVDLSTLELPHRDLRPVRTSSLNMGFAPMQLIPDFPVSPGGTRPF